jgi:hypothetical protein
LGGDVHAIGQIVQAHFALGENHVEIDDDGHDGFRETFNLQPSTSNIE